MRQVFTLLLLIGISAVLFVYILSSDVASKATLRSLSGNVIRSAAAAHEEEFGYMPFCEGRKDECVILSHKCIVDIGNALNDVEGILRATRELRKEIDSDRLTVFVFFDGDQDGLIEYGKSVRSGRCVIEFVEH